MSGKRPLREFSPDVICLDDVPDVKPIIQAKQVSTATIVLQDESVALFACRSNILVRAHETQIIIYDMTERCFNETKACIRRERVRQQQIDLPPTRNTCIKESSIYAEDLFDLLPEKIVTEIKSGIHTTFDLVINDHRALRQRKIGGSRAIQLSRTFHLAAGRSDIPTHTFNFFGENPWCEIAKPKTPMDVAFAIIAENFECKLCMVNQNLDEADRTKYGLLNLNKMCQIMPIKDAAVLSSVKKNFPRPHMCQYDTRMVYWDYMHWQTNIEQMQSFDTQCFAALMTLTERAKKKEIGDDMLEEFSKCLLPIKNTLHGANKEGYFKIIEEATFNWRNQDAFRRTLFGQGFYMGELARAAEFACNKNLHAKLYADNPNALAAHVLEFVVLGLQMYLGKDSKDFKYPGRQLVSFCNRNDSVKIQAFIDTVNAGNYTMFDVIRLWKSQNVGPMPEMYVVCVNSDRVLMIGEYRLRSCDRAALNHINSGIHPLVCGNDGAYKWPVDRDGKDDAGSGSASQAGAAQADALTAAATATAAAMIASVAAATASVTAMHNTLLMHGSGTSAGNGAGNGAAAASGAAAVKQTPANPLVGILKRSAAGSSSSSGHGAAASGAATVNKPPRKLLAVKRANHGTAVASMVEQRLGPATANNTAAVAGGPPKKVVNVYHVGSAASSLCPCGKALSTCSYRLKFQDHADVAELLDHFRLWPPKKQVKDKKQAKTLRLAINIRLQYLNELHRFYDPNNDDHKKISGSDGRKKLGEDYLLGHLDHTNDVMWQDLKDLLKRADLTGEFIAD